MSSNKRRNSEKEEKKMSFVDDMHQFLKPLPDVIDRHSDSQVARFYDNRCIFITGASGFVGKKLLRSCPNVQQIFILMRPKRGLDVCERVEALLRSELFERLKRLPNGRQQLAKVRALRGDITKPLFGLNQQDLDLLSARVSILMHSAATVKFEEPLKVAVENNVISVENLCEVASRLSNLRALVHVSTAYSNCDRTQVDEVFYETPMQADKLIEMSRWMKDEVMDRISPELLQQTNRPNTYTYTKACAESLILERANKLLPALPIAVVRPSIVAGTWAQPIRGWVDNFNGPTGVMLAMMSGSLQAVHVFPNYCADIVPVDMVANLIICSAWQICAKKSTLDKELINQDSKSISSRQITIFNCVSGSLNPLSWRQFATSMVKMAREFPINATIRQPGAKLISNVHLFKLYNFFAQTSFAYLGDFLLKLAGQKTKLVLLHNRLMRMINTLEPFTTKQWVFNCSNTSQLYRQMSPLDKQIFNFDLAQVDWCDYLERYYVGSKVFALKDDPTKMLATKRRLSAINLSAKLVQVLIILLAYYYLLMGSQMEKQTINFVLKSMTTSSQNAAAAAAITQQQEMITTTNSNHSTFS